MRVAKLVVKPLLWMSLTVSTLAVLPACSDGSAESVEGASEELERVMIDTAGPRPEYTIGVELRTAHPEVAAFVDQFLSTCLSGDYTGYRRLVSRLQPPETKERFVAVYSGLESVVVESIEPIEPERRSRIPAPAYRVISKLAVRPGTRLGDRGIRDRIAILVFKETGEWRMIPAPSKLQPSDEEPADTVVQADGPEEEERDFPWDEDVDH